MDEKFYLLESGCSNLHENFFDILPASCRISLLKNRLDICFSIVDRESSHRRSEIDTAPLEKRNCMPAANNGEETKNALAETKNASVLSTSGEGERETIVAHQQAQPSTNYDDVYFDASFEPYRAISASIKMPRTKVNLLVRNCVSSLVAKCAKKTSRAPTKTDFDDLAKKLLQYYPSLPKNIRRKIVKRYMNANANAKEKKTLKQ